VEGRLRIEEWTDRDGKNRYTLEVNATDLQFSAADRTIIHQGIRTGIMNFTNERFSPDASSPPPPRQPMRTSRFNKTFQLTSFAKAFDKISIKCRNRPRKRKFGIFIYFE